MPSWTIFLETAKPIILCNRQFYYMSVRLLQLCIIGKTTRSCDEVACGKNKTLVNLKIFANFANGSLQILALFTRIKLYIYQIVMLIYLLFIRKFIFLRVSVIQANYIYLILSLLYLFIFRVMFAVLNLRSFNRHSVK